MKPLLITLSFVAVTNAFASLDKYVGDFNVDCNGTKLKVRTFLTQNGLDSEVLEGPERYTLLKFEDINAGKKSETRTSETHGCLRETWSTKERGNSIVYKSATYSCFFPLPKEIVRETLTAKKNGNLEYSEKYNDLERTCTLDRI